MKKLTVYFALQVKRALRYFPFVLAIMLLICLALGIALGAIALVGWVFEFSRGQHAH